MEEMGSPPPRARPVKYDFRRIVAGSAVGLRIDTTGCRASGVNQLDLNLAHLERRAAVLANGKADLDRLASHNFSRQAVQRCNGPSARQCRGGCGERQTHRS